MTEKIKGVNLENSDFKMIRGQIRGMDEGVSAKSSRVDLIDTKIENNRNRNSKNKRNWWIIIGSIAGVILVALSVYELFIADSFSGKPAEIEEHSQEIGSTGIRVVGSSNVTSSNNTILGFDTGIEVINSTDVTSTNDTIIGP